MILFGDNYNKELQKVTFFSIHGLSLCRRREGCRPQQCHCRHCFQDFHQHRTRQGWKVATAFAGEKQFVTTTYKLEQVIQ